MGTGEQEPFCGHGEVVAQLREKEGLTGQYQFGLIPLLYMTYRQATSTPLRPSVSEQAGVVNTHNEKRLVGMAKGKHTNEGGNNGNPE